MIKETHIEKVKNTFCVALYNILTKILFTKQEDKVVERELPFNVKYKLQKDITIFANNIKDIEKKRIEIAKKYGEEVDGKFTIKDEESFKTDLMNFLDEEKEYDVYCLTEEEIDNIKDVNAECYEMELFINYLVEKKN